MLKETFYIDGVDARSVGLYLQRPIEFSKPIPVCYTEQIPGRNGSVVFDEGNYKNRTATADCFALNPQNVLADISKINRFLLSGNHGYRKLETSDDPDYFWMVRVENGARTEQRMRRLAPFEVTFDCMPQKFAKNGQNSIKVANGGVVYNDYGFDALPIISISLKTGPDCYYEKSYLTIGNTTISVNRQWWSYGGLNAALKREGSSVEEIKDNLRSIGVTAYEFGTALDLCEGNAEKFFEYITEFCKDETTAAQIEAALVFEADIWENAILFYTRNAKTAPRVIKIDSDEKTLYNELCKQDHNIYAPTFPVLKPGENKISWNNDIESVEIIPRWWCL